MFAGRMHLLMTASVLEDFVATVPGPPGPTAWTSLNFHQR
jgi:hypothetical protein